MPRLSDEMVMDERYQRPDGTPKNTGKTLHEDIVQIRVDDDRARSDYTIHVAHPNHSGGVRCFHRTCREMVVSGLQSHLDKLTDGDAKQVVVEDEADLGLTAEEVRPESYERTGAFAPETPSVEVSA